MSQAKSFNLHPVQTAALDPNELLEETQGLLNWLNTKESDRKNEWDQLKEEILHKDAKAAWNRVEEIHLRLSSEDPFQEKALIGWSTLQSLYFGYQTWEKYGFPYKGIFDPNPQNLEEAEARCREALLFTISYLPTMQGRANAPKENETHRHCLAYTLLSCLHSETPTLEGDLQRLRDIAYVNKAEPRAKETPKERIKILTQSILLLSYGGPVSKTEWSRPNQESIKNLLTYIYSNREGRITHLIPKETQAIHDALIKLELI